MATKLRELLETVNPNNSNALCNQYKGEFTANFTKWNVWGDKEIDFITDDCLEWATHKDAVTHFYEWMDSHITYADSQWKI